MQKKRVYLTPEQVEMIAREYPIQGAQRLADKTGVTRQAIYNLVNRLRAKGAKIPPFKPTYDLVAEKLKEGKE